MAREKRILLNKPINRTPVNKDSIEAMTPEKEKTVQGTFINIECPGQPAKVCGKYYPGMQYFTKTFNDNERCSIPLSVARFINERIYHERQSHILDENGAPVKQPQPLFRYKFMIEQTA